MEEVTKERRRQGRKPLPPEQRRSQYWVYLMPSVHRKLLEIGGSEDLGEALCNIAEGEEERKKLADQLAVNLLAMATPADQPVY